MFFLLLGLVVTLAYLPVILVSGADKLVANRFVVPLTLAELSTELPRSLASTWALWNRDIPLAVSVLLVAGFVVTTVMEFAVCLPQEQRSMHREGSMAMHCKQHLTQVIER